MFSQLLNRLSHSQGCHFESNTSLLKRAPCQLGFSSVSYEATAEQAI